LRHAVAERQYVDPACVFGIFGFPIDASDFVVDDALIAFLRAWLVTLAGVILHELLAQILHRRSLVRFGLRAAGVATLAHFGQPVLGHEARLFDSQFAELPQSSLAPFARIRAILKHEHPAACRSNLAQEAGHDGIAQFDRLRLRFRRLYDNLGGLIFAMMISRKAPIPSTIWEPNG